MSHPSLHFGLIALALLAPIWARAEAPVSPPAAPSPTDAERSEIAKKVAGRAASVKACYEAALRDDRNTAGKVTVGFTVGTQGAITEVAVVGASGAFKTCIETKFLSIRGWPILPAPMRFNQSFAFSKS